MSRDEFLFPYYERFFDLLRSIPQGCEVEFANTIRLFLTHWNPIGFQNTLCCGDMHGMMGASREERERYFAEIMKDSINSQY